MFDSGQKVPKVLLEIATRVLLNIKSHDKVFGERNGVVVKVLRYKPADRVFDGVTGIFQ